MKLYQSLTSKHASAGAWQEHGGPGRRSFPVTLVKQAGLAAGIIAIVAASVAGGALLGSSLLSEGAVDIVAANEPAAPLVVPEPERPPVANAAPQESASPVAPRLAARLPEPPDSPAVPTSPAEVGDARWAREIVAAPNIVPALAKRIEELQAFAAADDAPDNEAAAEPDPERTAAVPSPAAVEPPARARDVAPVEQQSSRPVTGSGTVSTAANLRSGPANNTSVLGTVGAGQRVEIVACDIWCEIVHDGRRGFVFAEFVRQGNERAAVPRATPAAVNAPEANGEARSASPSGETDATPASSTTAPGETTPAAAPAKPAITPPALIREENRGR